VTEIQTIIKTMLACAARIEELHPERKVTLDGHLVGSIGEVYARDHYGMTLADE
jgi:hypothetical protein